MDSWVVVLIIAAAIFIVGELLRPRGDRKHKRNEAIHHQLKSIAPRTVGRGAPIYQKVKTGLFSSQEVIVGYQGEDDGKD